MFTQLIYNLSWTSKNKKKSQSAIPYDRVQGFFNYQCVFRQIQSNKTLHKITQNETIFYQERGFLNI